MPVDKIPLAKATKIGQPVNGTSDSSIYVCCLTGAAVNMAVRNNLGHLSFRVESTQGELTVSALVKLKKLGFGSSKEKLYVSQHFKCDGGNYAPCGAYGALMEQMQYLFKGTKKCAPWSQVETAGV